MARYSTTGFSQAGQTSGVNSGLTVNGYLGYWGASATAGFRLRRVTLGIRTTTLTVPTSQQYSVAIYRQTTAPAGTGLQAAIAGQPMEIWTPQTDPTVGLIMTTAGTIGTTAPVLAAQPIKTLTLNSQTGWDYPFEFTEELVCNLGTANGMAFVIGGPTGYSIPANHVITLDAEIEV